MATQYKVEPIELSREDIESDEYRALEEKIQNLLTEEMVSKACIHEAGHIVLFELMNWKVRPLGPTIRCKDGEMFYRLGGVIIPELRNKATITYTVEKFKSIGMGLAAGGIFEERYLKLTETEWSDDQDKIDFCECWHSAMQQGTVERKMCESHLNDARNNVRVTGLIC
jgi:hypothetical protein